MQACVERNSSGAAASSACGKAGHELKCASALTAYSPAQMWPPLACVGFHLPLPFVSGRALHCLARASRTDVDEGQHRSRLTGHRTRRSHSDARSPLLQYNHTPATQLCAAFPSRGSRLYLYLQTADRRPHGGAIASGWAILTFERSFQRDDLWHRAHLDGSITLP